MKFSKKQINLSKDLLIKTKITKKITNNNKINIIIFLINFYLKKY